MPFRSGGSGQQLPAPRAPGPPRALSTGANPRGVAIEPSFQHAVRQVFAAQPPAQRHAIMRAAARNPSHPASRALIAKGFSMEPGVAAGSGPAGIRLSLGQIERMAQPVTAGDVAQAGRSGIDFGKIASGVGHDLAGFLTNVHPLDVTGQIGQRETGSPANALLGLTGKAAKAAGEGAAALHSLSQQAPGGNQLASIGSGPVAKNFVKNAASDAANLLGAPLTTGAMVAKDITHPRSLLNDFIAFPKQLGEHPLQTLEQHPLLALAVAQGGAAGLSRLAAAPVRALASEDSAVGKMLSTKREGVWLTGKLTHERPPFKTSPWIKGQQAGTEKLYTTRGPSGELLPANKVLRDRWINQGVGELAQMRERVRQVGQQEVKATHYKAFRGKVLRAVGHAAKNTLAYGPEHATVPGGDVAHLIADATVRRPETYSQDLAAYRDLIARNRPNLVAEGDKPGLAVHDANVKLLNAEIAAKRTPASLRPLFEAVAKDRNAYLPLEAKARAYGHFGADMKPKGLLRRAMYSYAATHMGARVDPGLGLVRGARQLPNEEIIAQLRKDTGGRMPTYVSHEVHPDLRENKNSAFYVPGERRPLPDTKPNTLYAYTHGLTNLGHTALLERRARLQNITDSHETQNLLVDQLANQLPNGGYARTHAQAKAAARGMPGMVPFNIAHPFHQQEALGKALDAGNVEPSAIEEEAIRRGIDVQWRTQDSGGTGKYGLIDKQALKALKQQQANISPDLVSRSFRALNNQFRTVVLSTSPKHVPGVLFENLIRDVAHGVGFRSWLTGRHIAAGLDRQGRTHLAGGQLAGMTEAQRIFHVSDHWSGTSAYPFLKAMEATFKTPGFRQVRTVWHYWTKLAIGGTKKMLEEQHQIAGLGKAALREHGYAEAAKLDGFTGLFHRALGLHGQLLEDATKGLFDPAKARQMRATINQMYGKWMDLSPHGQRALMFSPFGLWWVNSARFLARMPIDMPVKTGLLASATAATQQRRRAAGMDILGPGALPGYEIGGIPAGGKIIAQNYYSPFGTVNDPLATGASLFEPWLQGIGQAFAGLNFLNKPLASPGNPRGHLPVSGDQRLQAVIDSVLASFLPLYTKAAQVAEGGSTPYDVTNSGILPPLLRGEAPPTKTPGKGFAAGLKKATFPVREYKNVNASSSGYTLGSGSGGGASSSSGYLLGSGGGGSSSNGYVLGSGSP